MKIGEAAKCTGLSMSNIRFYEKKKLLTPKREDGNQYRDYTEEDIERLKKIMILRKLDIPIDTIQAADADGNSFERSVGGAGRADAVTGRLDVFMPDHDG